MAKAFVWISSFGSAVKQGLKRLHSRFMMVIISITLIFLVFLIAMMHGPLTLTSSETQKNSDTTSDAQATRANNDLTSHIFLTPARSQNALKNNKDDA